MDESSLTLAQRIRVMAAVQGEVTLHMSRESALNLVRRLEALERIVQQSGALAASTRKSTEDLAASYEAMVESLKRRHRRRVLIIAAYSAFVGYLAAALLWGSLS